MPRILALTRYARSGASSRVRFLQYIPWLEQAGIEVRVEPLFSDDDLRRLYNAGSRSVSALAAAFFKRAGTVIGQGNADIIWLQQEIFPFLPAGIESFLLRKRPYLIDLDDASYLYYQRHNSPLARALHADKIDHLMRHAAIVVAGNDTVAAYARDIGARRVEIIYSAVDCSRFPNPTGEPERFTVGWIGTPLTAAQSLPLIAQPLQKFLSETGAVCRLFGVDRKQFPELVADRLPWSEAGEVDFLSGLSLGLCPLADSAWTRGKSGYKIIQYMAAGKPVLASPVGIAGQLVEPGRSGFLCKTESEWHAGLMELYRNHEARQAMGRRARELAVSRYDSAIAARRLCDLVREYARA
jgi:glycosyltransferase involved in cell wall biosynthesis